MQSLNAKADLFITGKTLAYFITSYVTIIVFPILNAHVFFFHSILNNFLVFLTNFRVLNLLFSLSAYSKSFLTFF